MLSKDASTCEPRNAGKVDWPHWIDLVDKNSTIHLNLVCWQQRHNPIMPGICTTIPLDKCMGKSMSRKIDGGTNGCLPPAVTMGKKCPRKQMPGIHHAYLDFWGRIMCASSANLQRAALRQRGEPFFLISLYSSTCRRPRLVSSSVWSEGEQPSEHNIFIKAKLNKLSIKKNLLWVDNVFCELS